MHHPFTHSFARPTRARRAIVSHRRNGAPRMTNFWAIKSTAALAREAALGDGEGGEARPLKRTLTALNLITLGVGGIIGAGIFVLTGHAAAANAGPAIVALLPARRHRLRLRRPVLRRDGLHGPGRGQRLHLCLRHAGRARRLDHRLGPDPRIRRRRHHGGDRLVRLCGELPQGFRHRPAGALRHRAACLRCRGACVVSDRRDHEPAGDRRDRGRSPRCWSLGIREIGAASTMSSSRSSWW